MRSQHHVLQGQGRGLPDPGSAGQIVVCKCILAHGMSGWMNKSCADFMREASQKNGESEMEEICCRICIGEPFLISMLGRQKGDIELTVFPSLGL